MHFSVKISILIGGRKCSLIKSEIFLCVEFRQVWDVETNRLGRDKRVPHPLGFPILFSRRGQSGSVSKSRWMGLGVVVSVVIDLMKTKHKIGMMQYDCIVPADTNF